MQCPDIVHGLTVCICEVSAKLHNEMQPLLLPAEIRRETQCELRPLVFLKVEIKLCDDAYMDASVNVYV